MRLHDFAISLAAAVLGSIAPGCASSTSDVLRSDAETQPTITSDDQAVLEDPATVEDDVQPSGEVDDTEDTTEVDDLDDEAAPELEGLETAMLAKRYVNPVLSNCADPGVIRVGGASPEFWVACTGGGYPMFQSSDLVHWSGAGRMFVKANEPGWASMNWWAPEIHHVGGGLVAYFAAYSPSRGKMCIGAARAADVAGPWKDIGRPLVCDPHVGLIDPNVFTDGRGRHFLYYKTDSNGLTPQEPTIIYGHELGGDGVSFVGNRRRLLKNDLSWEGDVVEAPWVIARGKYVYMFYSGFRYCNATYGVGVARASGPLGAFKKKGQPILHSSARWSGPGHNSVVGTGGHDYLVYHAWSGAHQCSQGGNRELLLDRIAWKGGWPHINNGTPGSTLHLVPTVP